MTIVYQEQFVRGVKVPLFKTSTHEISLSVLAKHLPSTSTNTINIDNSITNPKGKQTTYSSHEIAELQKKIDQQDLIKDLCGQIKSFSVTHIELADKADKLLKIS
ncbi:hypothetical protein C1646_676262 [Rhizophagus diaphanus]|nr:hypothetical protein C1646_676262 [Rhizophagus diaphanus] [Rhizophagus sp. MUCL 43196]